VDSCLHPNRPSSQSAVIGSTPAARLAGINAASRPTSIIKTQAIASEVGSSADALNTVHESAQRHRGIRQTPLEGQSLVYTFDNPDAPGHSVQYFEMLGSRGIYKDGWWAGSFNHLPWAFPRTALLEALVRFVIADLNSSASPQTAPL
jgi:arylsulfatase A-like enzyme